jgi:aminoglycoside phosphotransferase (APT) family kinase protein
VLGRELGRAHAGVSMPPPGAPGLDVFPHAQPWILSVHQLAASQFERLSAGHMQVLALVRQYPEYKSALDALRAQWAVDGLVHGDMKFENCLVLAPRPGESAHALRVVDWELADFGDMYWDVGAVFQAYLSTWVLSMPAHDEASAEHLVSHARYPLESMQPAMAAFWRAYTAVRPAPAGLAPAALLTRCVQYAAARMIQTSYEHMGQATRVTMGALRMLQVSMNMLTRPADAIRDLLGMPEALQEAVA